MIDLHVHTHVSDGDYSVEDVINMAKNAGLEAVAITDHDTCLGIERACKVGKEIGIKVIPGIEMSVYHPNANEMHILGYYFEDDHNEFVKNLNTYMEKCNKFRIEKNLKLIEMLNNDGFNLNLEEVENATDQYTFTREQNFIQVLKDKGYISTYLEGIDRFFSKEKFQKVIDTTITAKFAINEIIKAGAIPVLAHPKRLNMNDNLDMLEETIAELKSYGLKGIECYYSLHTEEDTDMYLELAKKYNLFSTVGSDFHGPRYKPNFEIGYGINHNLLYSHITYSEFLKNIK